jgi:hypothetical protein
VAERDLHVDEGQRTERLGHEVLAPHLEQEIENVLIQHVPGADLLLHHVVARLLDVHAVPLIINELDGVLPCNYSTFPLPWPLARGLRTALCRWSETYPSNLMRLIPP